MKGWKIRLLSVEVGCKRYSLQEAVWEKLANGVREKAGWERQKKDRLTVYGARERERS